MAKLFVLNVPEFAPIIAHASEQPTVRINSDDDHYAVVEWDGALTLSRKAMKMKPAIWYGLFTGGLEGEIKDFGRDFVTIIGTNK